MPGRLMLVDCDIALAHYPLHPHSCPSAAHPCHPHPRPRPGPWLLSVSSFLPFYSFDPAYRAPTLSATDIAKCPWTRACRAKSSPIARFGRVILGGRRNSRGSAKMYRAGNADVRRTVTKRRGRIHCSRCSRSRSRGRKRERARNDDH